MPPEMCVAPPEFLFASVVAPFFQSLMSVLLIVNAVSAVLPSVSSTKCPSGISCDPVLSFSAMPILLRPLQLSVMHEARCNSGGNDGRLENQRDEAALRIDGDALHADRGVASRATGRERQFGVTRMRWLRERCHVVP